MKTPQVFNKTLNYDYIKQAANKKDAAPEQPPPLKASASCPHNMGVPTQRE